jgi:hypothetical protein
MIRLQKIQSQVPSIASDVSRNHDWRKITNFSKTKLAPRASYSVRFWISDALNNSRKALAPVHRIWLRSAPKCFHNYLWGFWRSLNHSEISTRLKSRSLSIWSLFNSAILKFRKLKWSVIYRNFVSVVGSPAFRSSGKSNWKRIKHSTSPSRQPSIPCVLTELHESNLYFHMNIIFL